MSKGSTKLELPVYLPTKEGVSDIIMGTGYLTANKLTIEFRGTVPGIATQRLLEKGAPLGIAFILAAEANPTPAQMEEKNLTDDVEPLFEGDEAPSEPTD